MKPMKTKSTRRLRARAAAMNTHDAEFDDYGPEPNMKLSHAFLVVLLLHVIAVGGLYAFNTMKASKAPKLTVARTAEPSNNSNQPGQQEPKPEDPKNRPSREKIPPVAKTSEAPKATAGEPKAAESGKTGENTPVNNSTVKTSPQPHQGLLAAAKAAFQRLTGIGFAGAGVATAAAQETNPQAADAPALPASQDTGAPKTYIVKAGDTITKISSSLGVTILDMEKANGLVGNAVLHVGQTLKVPEKMITQAATEVGDQASQVAASVQQVPGSIAATVASVVAPTQGTSNAPAATADMAEYTVVKGDSPYRIAKKFKVTPDELMKANNITDPKKIQIGQKLKIPASNSKKAATSVPAAQ